MIAYSPEVLDKRPDSDHDGIDDAEDACPDVPGDVDADPRKNGCRQVRRALLDDQDFDGVPDIEDACPDKAGVADPDPRKNGCPRRRAAPRETVTARVSPTSTPTPEAP